MRTHKELHPAPSTAFLLKKQTGCNVLQAAPLLMREQLLHIAGIVRAGRHIRHKQNKAEYLSKNVERERGAAVVFFDNAKSHIFRVFLAAAAHLKNASLTGFKHRCLETIRVVFSQIRKECYEMAIIVFSYIKRKYSCTGRQAVRRALWLKQCSVL